MNVKTITTTNTQGCWGVGGHSIQKHAWYHGVSYIRALALTLSTTGMAAKTGDNEWLDLNFFFKKCLASLLLYLEKTKRACSTAYIEYCRTTAFTFKILPIWQRKRDRMLGMTSNFQSAPDITIIPGNIKRGGFDYSTTGRQPHSHPGRKNSHQVQPSSLRSRLPARDKQGKCAVPAC